MHYLYILYSKKIDRNYSGQTKNIDKRFVKHNKGYSTATMRGIPWQLRKVIDFETKSGAIKAENRLKRMKSRKAAYAQKCTVLLFQAGYQKITGLHF